MLFSIWTDSKSNSYFHLEFFHRQRPYSQGTHRQVGGGKQVNKLSYYIVVSALKKVVQRALDG